MHHAPDDERARRRTRLDRSAAGALVLVGLGVAIGIVAAKSSNPTGLLDLHIYRDAARGISGGALYDYQDPNFGLGFTYPPFAAVLFAILGPLPVHVLEFGWTILSATSWLAVMACFWRRSVRARAPRWARDLPATTVAGVWLISLLSAPLWLALNQGQVGIFLWAALAADVVLTIDKRRGAGVLTGLAAATKVLPFVAIPLYAISGRARAAARAAVAFAGATLLGMILLPSESRRYWGELLWGTRVGERGDPRNDSLAGALTRAFGEGRLTTFAAVVLGLGVFALGLVAFRTAVGRNAPLAAILVLGSTMSLMAPITWTHHLVFLSLLLWFPLLSWRARPAASALVLAVVIVVLVDPFGAGDADAPLGSLLRAVVMLAILVFHDQLLALEQPQGITRSDNAAVGDSALGRR
jgi:alpha-1,2-mannosyltransferase